MNKKNGRVWIWAKCTKPNRKLRKMLFDETYFEESNINKKPLICSQDKIITKFKQKNGYVWFWAKCTKTGRKLMKIVIL